MTNEDQPRSGTDDETPDVPFDSPSPHSVGPPPPPEMFALYLETTDGRWTLASVLFDRADAEYRGKMNRMRRPWKVYAYKLVET